MSHPSRSRIPSRLHLPLLWSLVILALLTAFLVIPVPLWVLPAWITGLAIVVYATIPERRLTRFIGITTVTVATCLPLVVIEIAGRNLLSDILYFRSHEEFVERWSGHPDVLRYQPGVSRSRTEIGDLAAMSINPVYRQEREVTFFSDSRGFPNTPATGLSPCALVVLGDSFAAGTGSNRSWVRQLQSATGKNVCNLAVVGSPWHGLVNFTAEIDQLPLTKKTQVVLMLFSGNDLDDFYGPIPPEIKLKPHLFLESLRWIENRRGGSVLQKLIQRAIVNPPSDSKILVRSVSGIPNVLFYRPYLERRTRTEAEIRSHKNFAALIKTIHSINRQATLHGLAFHLVIAPSKEEIYLSEVVDTRNIGTTAFARTIMGVCREHDLACTDLYPPVSSEAKRQLGQNRLLYWNDDTHWNDEGHALAARLIASVTGMNESRVEHSPGESLIE